jgi:DNA helicase-2/ATP-dependent DNA helicase PcrA
VVNKPARGIGDTSLNALTLAARDAGVSLFKAASLPGLENFGLKGAAIGKIRAFCEMMEKAAREAVEGDAYDCARTLASESGLYLFYKADTSVEGQSRFANVEELLNSVKAYMEEIESEAQDEKPQVTLADYLENVSLLSNVDVADDETNNKVALMTVHTAKGLEFPYVFVAGMEENLFPSGGWMLTPQDLEEERRLFYVALTRAKESVSISFADTRMRNGKHESNSPSRFLRELAPQYLDKPLRREDFESRAAASDFDDDAPRGFRWSGQQRWPVKPAMTPSAKPVMMPSAKPAMAATPKPPIIDANFVPDPMTSFKVGDRIEHNRFGAGKILDIMGNIPDLKAKIVFDQYGEKLLLLKFAKIRHR